MSLEEIQREKESLDRERRELLLAEKRNKARKAELTVNEVKNRSKIFYNLYSHNFFDLG